MIHSEQRGRTTILRVEHGKVNAIDTELLTELAERLDEIERSSATAVVLTGTGKAFSAGVDLFRVLDGGQAYVDGFLTALSATLLRLFTFPRPVVAAVNGHAIAGGCIVVWTCDYKVMAEGTGRVGVTELLVGVPFPAAPLEIVRFAVPGQYVQEVLYTGQTYDPGEAHRRGLVDEVVAPEALLDRACAVATRFGAIPADAFRIVKKQLRAPVLDRSQRYAETTDGEGRRVWSSPEIHATIRDYLQRTLGKR